MPLVLILTNDNQKAESGTFY